MLRYLPSLILGVSFVVVFHHQLSGASVSGFVPIVKYTSSSIMDTTTSGNAKESKEQHRLPYPKSGSPSTVVSMIDDDGYGYNTAPPGQSGVADETNEVRVQPGTHDELMYALGVNLARQLGDIRPLVESGEELAQVAKGLLDTVVGRLNDDAQRLLLSSRGQELDQLIANRA
jgi:hypothetical protein